MSKYETVTETEPKSLETTDVLRYVSWVLILHQLITLPVPLLHAISSATYDTPIFSTNQTADSNTPTFLTTSYIATLILMLISIGLSIIGAIYANFRMSRPMKLSCGLLVTSLVLDMCIFVLEIVRVVFTLGDIILTPFVVAMVACGFILLILLGLGFVLKIATVLLTLSVLKKY